MLKWEVLPTAEMGSQDFKDIVRKMAEILRGRWRSASGKFRKENRRAYVRRRSESSDNNLQHIYDVRKQVCNSGSVTFCFFIFPCISATLSLRRLLLAKLWRIGQLRP